MSMTFTKLFSSLPESTVWAESDPIRIVWITMLAMADQKGRVWASVPGLANRARVSIPHVEEAIEKFMAPDPYSRTKDFEGRRIEEIDGGWKLLNHAKYRAIRDEEAIKESKRKYINTRRSIERESKSISTVEQRRDNTEADTDTEAEADINNKEYMSSSKTLDVLPKRDFTLEAKEVLNFLNEKAGRNYRPVETNLKFIVERLKSGVSVQDCRSVIAKKRREWIDDPKMQIYLRPATLFNKTKFEQYLGELIKVEAPCDAPNATNTCEETNVHAVTR